MKYKHFTKYVMGLTVLASMNPAFAKEKASILLVPNNGDAVSVLKSLQDHGFTFSQNITCPASARMVKVTPVAANSKVLKISCVSDVKSNTHAIPMKSINTSAHGDPNELEGTATGDPNEFEGTATGDPNEFEGSATGDPNEFEGSATGDPNEFEGTATGDPNEFEGNATGATANNGKSALVKALGKIEEAARSIHAKIYKLIVK